MKMFETTRPRNLQSIMIGLATRPPVLFHGKQALDTLWSVARTETIYKAIRQQARCVFQQGTAFEGSVTHQMRSNSMSISTMKPPLIVANHLPLGSSDQGFPTIGHISSNDYANSFAAVTSANPVMPQLGIEAWLVRELSQPNDPLARVALNGDDALTVYTAYTQLTPI
jgi:hypothetical protein